MLRYTPFHQCFIYTFNLSFLSISHTLTEPIAVCYTMEEHVKNSLLSLFWTVTWPNKIASTTIASSIYIEKYLPFIYHISLRSNSNFLK